MRNTNNATIVGGVYPNVPPALFCTRRNFSGSTPILHKSSHDAGVYRLILNGSSICPLRQYKQRHSQLNGQVRLTAAITISTMRCRFHNRSRIFSFDAVDLIIDVQVQDDLNSIFRHSFSALISRQNFQIDFHSCGCSCIFFGVGCTIAIASQVEYFSSQNRSSQPSPLFVGVFIKPICDFSDDIFMGNDSKHTGHFLLQQYQFLDVCMRNFRLHQSKSQHFRQ